ncbi:hypothetical protein [Legionella pneumophila]|uniref:hypothetical protein n=1 Tax=Legionella pneumophila TaxID=446 RepID=UPI0022B4BA53|nr:hypothetical protein [Legionella pneumophila]MCZ4701792.1 hypothetical protein [Legionella pneumophila]MCZ4732830.1 hypothetical protein [Legionella pneumophila]MCZ4753698.1 hypothetical protein [Legionella pneumophila]
MSNANKIKNKDKLSTESEMLVKVWDAHYDNKKKIKNSLDWHNFLPEKDLDRLASGIMTIQKQLILL